VVVITNNVVVVVVIEILEDQMDVSIVEKMVIDLLNVLMQVVLNEMVEIEPVVVVVAYLIVISRSDNADWLRAPYIHRVSAVDCIDRCGRGIIAIRPSGCCTVALW